MWFAGDEVEFTAASLVRRGTIVSMDIFSRYAYIKENDTSSWHVPLSFIGRKIGQQIKVSECQHKWKKYVGFTDTFFYCTVCNSKDTILLESGNNGIGRNLDQFEEGI